ncbi:TRIO and F-actin-binding protein [Heteronotia binoei]|uniref:TRIO and F-actin-binding protein n=1 Tax=Heteronotia binoei TaxID=13085 RepID=UPI00292D25EF|nr:TRIO and F-actin-binding protein [Heteronotia binoei]
MSEIADNTLCEKFEANVFAKSRCQNCFRALGAHQRVNQVPEERTENTSGCGDGTSNKSSINDQWDPLCILVPQCELYVCVGSEERSESCQESLEYTQLRGRTDEESEEESKEITAYPDGSTGTNIDVDTDATFSRDWEMTRLLDSILGSDKQNTMYYAGKKQEIRTENLHADRSRWSEATTSRTCGKTEPSGCLKAEPKVTRQDHTDKWRKPEAESGYFSLERRKSEPSCMSSPPPISRSPLPVHGDASRAGGYPTSSISSADSNLSCHMSGRSESQHGLMRQEYTVLADLPKPKRISHREAFEKERSSSRTRSPGRAEVERIFGHERRKSETLGAFQALEEGILDRLDSKTLKLAKEGRLTRRKSSPTLHREMSKRLPWEPEQPKRNRGESLHMGRPQQQHERISGSPSGSLRSGSPTLRLERESRSKGGSLHSAVPPQQMRGERRKREESAHSAKGDRERTPLHASAHGKQMDSSRKSGLETVHQHTSSGKTTDSKWKNCLGALHTPSPAQNLDKSQTKQRVQLERYKESDRRARGKPLLPVDTAEHPRKDVRDCREVVHTLSPGRGMAAPGKDGPTLSPRRQVGGSWGGQEETRHSLRPGSSMGTSLKSHREVGGRVIPERCTRGNQGDTRRSLSPERSVGTSFRSHGEVERSTSPQRYTGDNQRETRRSFSPERSMGTSFRSHGEVGHSASPQRYTGGSQRETKRSLSPERSMVSSFKGHGEVGHSASPQRYTGGSQRETRRSLSPERSMVSSFKGHGEVGHSASPQRYTDGSQRETRRSLSPERSVGSSFKGHGEVGHSASPQRYTDGSQRETRRSLSPERSVGSSFKGHGEVGHSAGPQRYTGGSQRETRRSLSPERSMGAGFRSHGEAGHSTSPHKYTGQRETRHSLSPDRSMGIDFRSHGEAGHSLSPHRYTGESQRESGRSFSPERYTGESQRESGRSFSPERYTGESQRESGRSFSPERYTGSRDISEEVRHYPSSRRPEKINCSGPRQSRCHVPPQHPENSWKSQKEILVRKPRISADSEWPSKGEQSTSWTSKKEDDLDRYGKSLYPTSPPVAEEMRIDQGEPSPPVNPFWTLENNEESLEGPLCHTHPMQLMEKEQISSREHPHSTKPGQQHLETERKTQASSAGWIENKWVNQERCQSPMRPEKKVENDGSKEEKFSHQPQIDRGPPPKTACSSQSQDPNLNANQKHQPDLLNFKKGWMSILDEPGEWKKHWFVLTDSSLKYYRDSNAEEADDLDGEIDLRSCTDVTEYAVQRNYGFQIHTKDGVFTLSAMTSGIRRNWIEALRKSIRPASVPDVTKLSDCNKENSFRSYGSQKSSLRSEEQRSGTGPEVIPRGASRKADGQRHAFDYVELSPLQHGPLNQGSPQRTRGSTRASDAKREELERDLALRSEERRKWFEAPASGVLQTDGPAGDASQKAGGQEPLGAPLSEAQRSRLSEEIEKKWQELERLPFKESKRVPLMALLNQGKGSHEDTSEALEKEVQALKSQLETLCAQSKAKSHTDGHTPRGYISQDACERSLAEMEASHRQVMMELQRHHQREMERLHLEKERLLAEEAAATAAAIEALKKAHREELNRELGRTRSFQKGDLDSDALRRQHESDVESLKRELQVLSEQYSQKCLEIGDLVAKAEEQEQILQHCQQEGKELLRHNQELQRRLSEEIGQLRAFIATQSSCDSHNNEKNTCELEVLLRVKENELQYLKKEVQCLKEELQMMQKDKRFASGKYQDVYVELNYIKRRSEREIEQLKEHLRLAMAALQEKETLHNSIGK